MKTMLLCCVTLLVSFTTYCQSFTRSQLPTELFTPWEITYGPDNFLWITEAGGKVSRVNPTTGDKTIVYDATDYYEDFFIQNSPFCGRSVISGTFGLALHPDFLEPETAYIYFVYSYNSGTAFSPATKFRIKRLKWDAVNNIVTEETNIINNIPTGYDHVGGRLIAIKQDNIPYLFYSLGDLGANEDNCYNTPGNNPNTITQDVTTMNGKIHRFNMDGTIPADNPITGNSFYTRGHRNPQGLMYNSDLGILYDIEHGADTDDEINILQKGMNYGWKEVRGYHDDESVAGEADYVANYTPNPLITDDALIEPLYSWCNELTGSFWLEYCTVAPSDGIYYNSNGIPEWTNSLLIVTLKDGVSTNKEVYQFKLQENGELVPSTTENPNPKRFFAEDQGLNGRLRDITFSPDGRTIYLINNRNGNSPTGDLITVYTYEEQEPTLSLSDINLESNLLLHPNPVSDKLKINGLEGRSNIKEVDIYSTLGRLQTLELDNNKSIDVSKLSSGVYFIHIKVDNQSYKLRFIKS